jgi:7,8-dihydroneopterin aldolase/epimerase/oxygenase
MFFYNFGRTIINMLIVSLEGMRFFSNNGMYPEEKLIGNEWIIDVHISFMPETSIKTVQQTVDYEVVYEIVKAAVQEIWELIEELAHEILKRLKERFPFSKKLEIRINKKFPPLPGEVAQSKITWMEEF